MPPGPIKFLLVDDLEGNLLALEALLKRDGLELLKAHSGAEALELLLVHDVALALVDVQMPEVDGFELAELMRGTERTRRVPIIFVTAGATTEKRRFRGYELGAVDFLLKPIDPHILKSKADVFFELACQRNDLKAAAEENVRARAEAERASKAKDEFLAALSHELRTPLTPVLLAVQMLEDDDALPEYVKDDMTMIRRNVQLETRLIDDLLDLTRITRGKLHLQETAVDVHTLLRHAAETCFDDTAGDKHLHLQFDLGATDSVVWGDPARLGQVFWNLIRNAVKFTPHGGVITLHTQNPSAGRLVVQVSDTGIGIEPDVLPLIFNRLEQGGVGRQFGGLGLGLAISRNLTELHGGRISARSAGRDCGAEFAVDLPVLSQTDPRARDAGTDRDVEGLAQRAVDARRILLVEDHGHTANILSRLLARMGHEVRHAATATDALQLASAQPFDLVISDLGLPDGSGHDLMRTLRSNYGLRGIALSGFGMEEDIRRSREAGFDDHFVKPVDLRQLTKRIRESFEEPVLS